MMVDRKLYLIGEEGAVLELGLARQDVRELSKAKVHSHVPCLSDDGADDG